MLAVTYEFCLRPGHPKLKTNNEHRLTYSVISVAGQHFVLDLRRLNHEHAFPSLQPVMLSELTVPRRVDSLPSGSRKYLHLSLTLLPDTVNDWAISTSRALENLLMSPSVM